MPIPVFRIQDTGGEGLDELYKPAELPPLFDVAARIGVEVSYIPAHAAAGFRGFYVPGTREISLCTEDVRTFFHELAHAAHDIVLGGTLNDCDPAEAEIVAETTAAVLCHLYGYDGYLWHGARYIERYADGGNAGKAAARHVGTIQKVLGVLINAEGDLAL